MRLHNFFVQAHFFVGLEKKLRGSEKKLRGSEKIFGGSEFVFGGSENFLGGRKDFFGGPAFFVRMGRIGRTLPLEHCESGGWGTGRHFRARARGYI